MTVRDNVDYIRVLLYSDYITFTVGGPPKPYRIIWELCLHYIELYRGTPRV